MRSILKPFKKLFGKNYYGLKNPIKFSNTNIARFATSNKISNYELDKYPDEIINEFNKSNKTEEGWRDFEVDITNNIHFLDTDQFVDVICMFSNGDKGSEAFWDLLTRKIQEYNLDYVQSAAIMDALDGTDRPDYFVYDPLYKNFARYFSNNDKESQLVQKFHI
jgi:hypothetical protein